MEEVLWVFFVRTPNILAGLLGGGSCRSLVWVTHHPSHGGLLPCCWGLLRPPPPPPRVFIARRDAPDFNFVMFGGATFQPGSRSSNSLDPNTVDCGDVGRCWSESDQFWADLANMGAIWTKWGWDWSIPERISRIRLIVDECGQFWRDFGQWWASLANDGKASTNFGWFLPLLEFFRKSAVFDNFGQFRGDAARRSGTPATHNWGFRH